jgi:hypothetical protein
MMTIVENDDENEDIANISISHRDKDEAQNPICELCHIMYGSTMREAIQFDFTHVIPTKWRFAVLQVFK